MILSFKRIAAIAVKELHDFKTNINILIMYIIPIMIAYIYDKLIPGMPEGFALMFGLLFLVVLVGMYVPPMMIAEEKEKKTLSVLLLSPAIIMEGTYIPTRTTKKRSPNIRAKPSGILGISLSYI